MTPTNVATTLLFALTGTLYAVRLVTDRGRDQRLLNLSHLLMAATMISTGLGRNLQIPAALQLTVFTGFALWYVYLAMFRPYAVESETATAGPHHVGRARLTYHAAMMLAMAAMAVMMAPSQPADALGMGMAMGTGMDMPGHPSSPASGASAMPGWTADVSIVIGVGFTAAALWYLIEFIRRAGTRRDPAVADRRRLIDPAASAAMAAGMALAFIGEMT